MKKNTCKILGIAAALALAVSPVRTCAQTVLTNTYIQPFNTSASTVGWLYWYGQNPGNSPLGWDGTMDAAGDTNSSGALHVDILFNNYGQQQTFFGSFDDQYGYDFTETANGLLFSSISFDIKVAPTTQASPNGDFGKLNIGFYNTGVFTNVTIPGGASNGWYHMSVPISAGYNVSGIGDVAAFLFEMDNYSTGYPTNTMEFWMDNMALNLSAGPPPPPPTLSQPTKPIPGLNLIDTTGSAAGDRYQVCNTNDGSGGLSFVGQSSATYSWTINTFPTNDPGYSYQAHFFIVSGSDSSTTVTTYPGPYDQAADYNLANCVFVTVQSDGNGGGYLEFRYKTNSITNNLMLFNNLSPTNPANSNGWPVMPVCALDDTNGASGLLGTWSLTFGGTTNVTITGPSGKTTNFVMDATSAALFADPCSLLLGAQPNGTYGGQDVVYSSFSLTGTPAAYTDNFLADASLQTNHWEVLANDTNGVILVPTNSAYWVGWTLPDLGFSLQVASNLPAGNSWVSLASVPTIDNNGGEQALVSQTNLPSTNQGYFTLVEHTFSQLLVLLPGEVATPGTAPGYSGTPTAISTGGSYAEENVTVEAVDSNFNPVGGITDTISITSSDGTAILPNPEAMANGTVTFDAATSPFLFGPESSAQTFTITATDTTSTNIPPATSASVSVGP